ncbi:PilW family protein [Pseudomonas sp. 5P_3.1_Bac2]|uniref:PilW family protein n=1 Tax=Pseudomonas sp. 5P_3.1_Bac2 TaxID=2971617 RepID=UPI0021CA28E1|nr:prepilin-type N-terminal cleavage/methylation domain-containing protein [Pseudomonas sp. 5P_3.1_Bac2]MCU1718154.1 prepilin-type N-terminal cleavage/methylation domain-containing protein [Pseudomonas sp. 5P_3.1_Bac2]
MRSLNQQSGLSLIELMVTLLLSTILLLGVMQLFINTSNSDRTSNELARVQETGRVVMELIAQEARRAGYQGCVSTSSETETNVSYQSPNATVDIKFPANAINGTASSLVFSYARPNPSGAFKYRDCANNKLEPYQIIFSNCQANLCMRDPNTGASQQVAANTNIQSIQYIQSCGANNCIKTATTADMGLVRQIQVTLAVTDSRGEFEQPRLFTSVIELRNRL